MRAAEWLEDNWLAGLLVLLVVACTGLLIWAAVAEDIQWQKFSAAHQCKIVAREQGHLSTGVGFVSGSTNNSGVVVTTTSTPAKVAYACDDGVTYWRND
jgi:hypothetical protein